MITFVAPTYNEAVEPYLFISSLLLQKNNNWKAIIYSNGINPICRKIVEHFNDARIMYKESPENTGFWGCYNRIDALNNMINTEYVCQTSIQDYFTPNAVEEVLSYNGVDLIYWNSLHNHFSWNILDSRLEINHIDWGNFAIKTEIAKRVGINKPEYSGADGFFIGESLGHIKSTQKIAKIITVHN
jgi:hypothetical protein